MSRNTRRRSKKRRRKASGPRTVHIDTDVLLIAAGVVDDADLQPRARKFLNNRRHHTAVASFTTLGEFVNEAQEAGLLHRAQSQLDAWLGQGKLETAAFGADADRLQQVARDLVEADYHLGPTDALILAAMLLDDHAEGIVTTELMWPNSAGLQKLMEARGRSFISL